MPARPLRLIAKNLIVIILAALAVSACNHGREEMRQTISIDIDSAFAAAVAAPTDSLSADAIYLSMALLHPDKSTEALRRRAIEARSDAAADSFPLVAVDAMWGAAAWECYCVTGDRKWLKEAFETLKAAELHNRKLTRSDMGLLSYGIPEYAVSTTGYYPVWASDMERFQTLSTSVNAERAYTYYIMSLMAAELQLKEEREYKLMASTLRSDINDRLWLPELQRYGAYLYGIFFPIVNRASDAVANSLCVLFDIATPEMASALVAEMPIVSDGIPLLYPGITTTDNATAQTLFALAAAKVRNPAAFAAASSSLHSITTSAGTTSLTAALITRGFFGMSLEPDGIRFSPMVPPDNDETKHIRKLRYREATFDISLHGTGDRIASFAIDSVATSEPFVSADMRGHHYIDIILTGNNLTDSHVNIAPEKQAISMPKLSWSSQLTAHIDNYSEGTKYNLYVDGALHREIAKPTFNLRLASSRPAVIAITARDDDGNESLSPRSHYILPAGTEITVKASSVTPRRPPLHFINDRATATNYIELAARHNTRITCYAYAETEGEYFLTVGYSNGSPRCALRTLAVNDRDCATLLFPQGRLTDWITVMSSNTVTVKLRKGSNKIALTYIRGTLLLNKITLQKRP